MAAFGAASLTSRGGSDVFVAHVNDAGFFRWVVGMGGVEGDQGNGIASDGAGGALVMGGFKGTAAFGAASLTSKGSSDVLVAHVSGAGVVDWAVGMGG
eukprot:49692-Prymnesium_polylepis.1